jgi:hypothetical protein
MQNQDRTHRLTGWHATVVRWLLLGVVLRALLPVGYMPQFGTPSGEAVAFVICTEHGLVQTAKPDSGPQTPGEAAHKASDVCAFGGLAHLFQPTADSSAFGIPLHVATTGKPFLRVSTPPTTIGPHVGARAPPFYS